VIVFLWAVFWILLLAALVVAICGLIFAIMDAIEINVSVTTILKRYVSTVRGIRW